MRRSKKVASVLEARLPGVAVRIVEKKGSGAFEVQADRGPDAAPGATYHSKLGGDGHLDCYPEKLDRVVAAIQADMAKKQ